MSKLWLVALTATAALALGACSHAMPGTHVELVDRGGSHVYVGGAAGPGISQGVACAMAVQRAVTAIAERFAADQSDVAEHVAKAMGLEDGRAFLERYVHDKSGDAAVHDVRFDPIEHFCLATVSWTPPLFVEKAVLKYAHQLEAAELGSGGRSSSTSSSSGSAAGHPAATPSAPATAAGASSKPAPTTGASSAPPAATRPVAKPAAKPACAKEANRLHQALDRSRSTQDDYDECLRRAGKQQCYDYGVYRDEAKAKQKSAQQAFDACRKAFGG